MDKKGKVRGKFKTRVDISYPNLSIENCKSKDISVNGVFIISKERPLIDTLCDVTIILESGVIEPIKMKLDGKVVRYDEDGFAVTFLKMDSTTFFHLKNIVKYNTENIEEFLEQCRKNVGFK
ncbi:MAG: PilZ domain-containing protein [Bacteriovoracaceae bacterium]|nr:PilZ domain-containing protein [Bacteriovoracaceae bacterium]